MYRSAASWTISAASLEMRTSVLIKLLLCNYHSYTSNMATGVRFGDCILVNRNVAVVNPDGWIRITSLKNTRQL